MSKECYIPPHPPKFNPQFDVDKEFDWFSNLEGNLSVLNPITNTSNFNVPEFEESESALISRCNTVLSKLIEENTDEDLVIVSHAPCLLAFALAMSGETAETANIEPWVLGGVNCYVQKSGKVRVW